MLQTILNYILNTENWKYDNKHLFRSFVDYLKIHYNCLSKENISSNQISSLFDISIKVSKIEYIIFLFLVVHI
jgi:hypothetical protein